VLRRLEETGAAKQMMVLRGSPSFSGAKDVRGQLARADMSGVLNTRELLDIAGLLQCARLVRAYGEGEETDAGPLGALFRALSANRYLEERITTAVVGEDEIADAASPALADIRRKLRVANSKVRETLQKIITSPSYSKALQEPIITTRSDRYVVPVRVEHKGAVPGLVHDVSASGATVFIEPMAAVKANNEVRELRAKEKQEIERILMELSAACAEYREDITCDFNVLVTLDLIFAKAKLSYKLDCTEPELTERELRLKKARHPLLDPKKAVPIDAELGGDFDTLVITGPNTGGKTVTLKTFGLLCVMAQCGLHIPAAEGSRIPVLEGVLADIGDEQSIEQSLSTFSAHMRNIVQVVEQCDDRSLVLFDELGAGTDPAEGAALAISLIEFCRQQGSRVAATTHYAELKVYAMRSKGVTNAACEFDVDTLKPTYKLLIGVPGKSNAFAISRRLGLPEEIITAARNTVSQNDLDFEEVLDQLEQQRQQMEQAREEAERLQRETLKVKEQSDAYYAEIKKQKERAEAQARREAQAILDEARRTANEVSEELRALRKQMRDAADAQGVNIKQAELRRQLNEAEKKLAPRKEEVQRPKPSREIRVGDTVELLKLGTKATVLAINKDGTYQLHAGIMKVNVKPEEVYLLENEQAEVKKFIDKTRREFKNTAQSPELDLRGMDALEASAVLSIFIDNAFMANLSSVRIIHGKGTGVLRKTVHEELKRNKHVKKYRLGVYGEGEDGVTIAELS
jgi:DNA mismatch repair protein MutS2